MDIWNKNDPSLWKFEEDMTEEGAPTRVVLGVDGGSTSTVCVCIQAPTSPYSKDDIPVVLGRATAGCSNHNSVGHEASKNALECVLAGALKDAGLRRDAVQAVCLAVSGVDTSKDEDRIRSWLRHTFPKSTRIYSYNDAVAALASGTCGILHGCVLVVGTGTIAFGFTSDGRRTRSSGYGPLLGDQGSGYAIASQALAAVMRAHDGRGPQTGLANAILNELSLKHLDELISWAYSDTAWARIAALVPVVKACAAAGDDVAKAVLKDAVQELALNVISVVRKLDLAGEDGKHPFPLVLVGGVLEKNVFDLSSLLVDQLVETFPRVEAIRPHVEPALGAALLAGMQSLEDS